VLESIQNTDLVLARREIETITSEVIVCECANSDNLIAQQIPPRIHHEGREMTMLISPASEHEFPQLLKKWRKQRRLSQLDFSLDAGISQKHLSFLESGRSKPSRDMVMTISEALELPLRERNQLLHSAGFAQVYKQRALDNDEMAMVRDALQMSLKHHEPYPAIVADRNWNLLMANDASLRLVGLLGDPEEVWQKVDPSGDKNVYRMTFSEHGMRPVISNWDEMASHLMQRLQRELSADLENEYLAELHKEIAADFHYEDKLGVLGSLTPIAPILPMHMTVGGITLKTFSMISSFGTAQDITAEEIKVETFFPADDFTKTFFQGLC
jgi:transcriptional regulator with XRE-family HTH domain